MHLRPYTIESGPKSIIANADCLADARSIACAIFRSRPHLGHLDIAYGPDLCERMERQDVR